MGRLTGGVLHSKFWVVDGRHVYVGSANMDWRSLTQVSPRDPSGDAPCPHAGSHPGGSGHVCNIAVVETPGDWLPDSNGTELLLRKAI